MLTIAVFTHYSALYGANLSLLTALQALRVKYRFVVFVPDANGHLIDQLKKIEIEVVVLPFGHWVAEGNLINLVTTPLRWAYFIKHIFKVQKEVERFQPLIIYSNSSVIFAGAFIAWRLGLKHVWHIREFAKVHYNYRFDLGDFGFKHFLNKASTIISISDSLKHYLEERTSTPIKRIYNGIITKAVLSSRQRKWEISNKDKEPFFLLVGLLHPSKGQAEAIAAIGQVSKVYPNVSLKLVGDGTKEYLEELETYVDKLFLNGKVVFCGYRTDTEDLFMNCLSCIVASRHEAMGRVAVEAMSYGKPVIAHNSGASPEVVLHKQNGWIYDTVDELSDYMLAVLKGNYDPYQIALNNFSRVEQHFTAENYAKAIDKVIEDVVCLS